MADITRPDLLRSNDLRELLRWTKHTTDNVAAVNAPQQSRCEVYAVDAQNITTGTQYVVSLDGVSYAEGQLMQNPDLLGIRCASAGLVQVCYSFQMAGSAAGTYRGAYIQRARTLQTDIYARHVVPPSPGAVSYAACGYALVEVQAGDVLQLVALQNSGGNLALALTGKVSRMSASYLVFT
jgi:hypothetical protein